MQLEDLSGIALEELIELIQHEVLKIESGLFQNPDINQHTKTEIIECCKNIVEALGTRNDRLLHLNSLAMQIYTLSLIIDLTTTSQT